MRVFIPQQLRLVDGFSIYWAHEKDAGPPAKQSFDLAANLAPKLGQHHPASTLQPGQRRPLRSASAYVSTGSMESSNNDRQFSQGLDVASHGQLHHSKSHSALSANDSKRSGGNGDSDFTDYPPLPRLTRAKSIELPVVKSNENGEETRQQDKITINTDPTGSMREEAEAVRRSIVLSPVMEEESTTSSPRAKIMSPMLDVSMDAVLEPTVNTLATSPKQGKRRSSSKRARRQQRVDSDPSTPTVVTMMFAEDEALPMIGDETAEGASVTHITLSASSTRGGPLIAEEEYSMTGQAPVIPTRVESPSVPKVNMPRVSADMKADRSSDRTVVYISGIDTSKETLDGVKDRFRAHGRIVRIRQSDSEPE